jgi:aconitase B
MKMTNEKKLKNKLVTMLKEDWNGKKGYLTDNSDDIYQYLNFDQISQYQKSVGHIALDTILKS